MLNNIKFRIMRQVLNRSTREFFSNIQALFIGKNNYDAAKSAFLKNDDIDKHGKELMELGYTEFNFHIGEAQIAAIKEHLGTLKCFDPYRSNFGDFELKDAPSETHTAHYHRHDLVVNETIMKIANDEGILKLVQSFLKAKPTISNVNAWWSFSGKEQAEQAQLFHRDLDDYRFCKLFIYLTDVSAASGPHVFVKNTSNSDKLSKIRRYSDKEVEDAFGKENVVTLIRPQGACFIVNTYGFHKGLLPSVGDRLLLQVQYSLNPIAIEDYSPISISDMEDLKNYTNRLLIK